MPLQLPRYGERYSPLYFLAALGSGGLLVTFFLNFMFWVPHPGQPVPLAENIIAAFLAGNMGVKAMITATYAGILFFAALHFRLLAWNLSEFATFRRARAYRSLRSGNAETQLLAIPLTLAMSVNVGFILGLVFIPNLWSIIEYLFPLAMLTFVAIGVYAFRILGDFLGRILTDGGFDCANNNSFAQMLPAFALAMVGVGLAAPAAMSTIALIAGLSYLLSSFFIVSAVILGAIALFLGVRAMMENGASRETAPTLWVAIPIVTIVSIALMRQGHGLHVHFDVHGGAAATFTMLTEMLAVQLLFGLLGFVILRRQNYFARFVHGTEKSPGSYALVCPGVALSVMVQFFVNKGLVAAGLIDKFSAGYWALTAIAVVLQAATIALMFRLNAKHFDRGAGDLRSVPA